MDNWENSGNQVRPVCPWQTENYDHIFLKKAILAHENY